MNTYLRLLSLTLVFICSFFSGCSKEDTTATPNSTLENANVQSIQCPSQKFEEFFAAYSKNEALQKYFIKDQIRIHQFYLDDEDQKRLFVKNIRKEEMQFPIFFSEDDNKLKTISVKVDLDLADMADEGRVFVSKNNAEFATYWFEHNTCWQLISIEYHDIDTDKNKYKNLTWLEQVFPAPNYCTPEGFYYDNEKKASYENVLENRGYKPYLFDKDLVYYKINEKFYGVNATEIAIPSGTFSDYVVVVGVDAASFKKNLELKTGVSLKIHSADGKSQNASGVGYIFPKNNESSYFICTSYEG